MSVMVFDGESWVRIKNAYIFHEVIGFVTLSSIRCYSDGEWRVIPVGERELVGL